MNLTPQQIKLQHIKYPYHSGGARTESNVDWNNSLQMNWVSRQQKNNNKVECETIDFTSLHIVHRQSSAWFQVEMAGRMSD